MFFVENKIGNLKYNPARTIDFDVCMDDNLMNFIVGLTLLKIDINLYPLSFN